MNYFVISIKLEMTRDLVLGVGRESSGDGQQVIYFYAIVYPLTTSYSTFPPEQLPHSREFTLHLTDIYGVYCPRLQIQ